MFFYVVQKPLLAQRNRQVNGFHFDPPAEHDILWSDEPTSDDYDSDDVHDHAYGDSTSDGTTTEDELTGEKEMLRVDGSPLESFPIEQFCFPADDEEELAEKEGAEEEKAPNYDEDTEEYEVDDESAERQEDAENTNQNGTKKTNSVYIITGYVIRELINYFLAANPEEEAKEEKKEEEAKEEKKEEEEELHCRAEGVEHPVEGRSIAAGMVYHVDSSFRAASRNSSAL